MTAVNNKFYIAVSSAVIGLAFIFGWNISAVNAAKMDWINYYSKSTYSDFWATYVVGSFAIGAIIGSVLSGPVSSKFGPKGSMIYVSLMNIAGVALIYLSFAMHPNEKFKEDEKYMEYQEKLYNDRSETEQSKEKRENNGTLLTFEQWQEENSGYSHLGFGDDFPTGLYALGAGRVIIGMFVGLASAICPRYIIDISPKEIQGKVGVCNQLFITVGILVANLFGLEQVAADNWLFIMIFPGFVSIAFIVVLSMGFLPESPKYLISIDKDTEARQALEAIRGTSYNCDQELDAMNSEKSSSAGGETSISGLFSIPGIRWQLFTLIFMHIAQPMSGINAVFFYSNDIFKSVGVEEGSLAYYSIALSTLNVVMTIVSTAVIEQKGRKLLLLGGYVVATGCMILLTFAIAQQAGSLSLISLLGFIAGFAVGPGPIPWIYNSELFPANSRSASGMVGCIVNWGFNFIVAKFFPGLEESMGSNVFWIFIIFSIVTVFYCYSVVPETKNKSANEVYNMFAKRNGVSEEQEEEMQDLRAEQ